MIYDHMLIEHEIALLKFQQFGLTTDSIEWRDLQQEIFRLQEEKNWMVYNYRPHR